MNKGEFKRCVMDAKTSTECHEKEAKRQEHHRHADREQRGGKRQREMRHGAHR
jgi:hypothetical protein